MPTQDLVLGIYYLTKAKINAKGEGRVFANIEEVLMVLEAKQVETLTPIRLRYTGPVLDMTTAYDDQDLTHTEPVEFNKQYINTTVGRASLEAVANPARTRDLFFVADGSGGHAFTETYDQHQKNVAKLRSMEKQIQNDTAEPADDVPPAAAGAAPDSNPTATTKPGAPKKPAKPARQGAAQSTATPPVVQR